MSEREVSYEYVTTTSRFEEILVTHADEPRYTIDSEFLQNKTFIARLALVQIAFPDFIVLVDPFTVDLTVLQGLFASSALAIMHSGSNDLPLLRVAVGTLPQHTFDTELAALLLGRPSVSLQGLARDVLGIDLDKSEQVRDWTLRPIPLSALDYAANDVIHLFDLADELTADLESCGRLEAHAQECAWQCQHVGQSDREMTWWRAKSLHRASMEERLRAQYLFAARDDLAEFLNLPRNYIVAEETAIELVRTPPATRDVLVNRLRNYRGTLNDEDFDQLWNALVASASATPTELRVPDADIGDGEMGLWLTLGKLYVRFVAHEWRLAPNFLASHRDLVKFFRGEESRLDLGWRRDAVGSDLELLRERRGVLRVRDDRLTIEVDPTSVQ